MSPIVPSPTLRTLVLVVGLLVWLPAAEAEAKTLKIATLMPEGSGWVAQMRKAGEAIEARTDGRVELKLYPGGVMGNDKTVLRKIRARQLDGGAFPTGPLATAYPDVELYSLPLLFRDYGEIEYVRARMDPKLVAGLEKAGLVALAITDGGFAYVLSQRPLRSVEDMPGIKIWIPEGDVMSQTALEITGVSPVPLPLADVFTALQTGLIDTVAAPPAGAIAFQWHNNVSYLTDVPLMYLMGILVLDARVFGALSAADQQVVREEIAKANQALEAESRTSDANAREALRNKGIEFVTAASDEELDRWRRIGEESVTKLRALGRYDDATIDELLALVEQYRAKQGTE